MGGEEKSSRCRITLIMSLVILIVSSSNLALDLPLSSCGILNQTATYILQEDITSDLTCLVAAANNITIDLDGHTLTYSDITGHLIQNPSFEQWTGVYPEHWTSTSPDIVKVIRPPNEEWGFDGDIRIVFDSPQSAQEIRSDIIQLKAGVIYAFYSDISNQMTRYPDNLHTLGNVSLVLRSTTGEELNRITSDSPWTLNLFGTYLAETDIEARLVLMVNGENLVNNMGNVSFDTTSIYPYRAYGIAITPGHINPSEKAYFPYIPDEGFKGSVNLTVKNGIIRQGEGGGTESHAITARYGSWLNVFNVTTSVSGVRTSSVYGGIDHYEIANNTLYNNGTRVVNRHSYIGAISTGANGTIHDNTVIGSPQAGIVCNYCTVYNNYVYREAKETNGYNFQSYGGKNNHIFNNTFISRGGRGLHISENSNNWSVHDNYIYFEGLPNIEYGFAYQEHGMKFERANNSQVYNNYVIGVAQEGHLGINTLDVGLGYWQDMNNSIYNNTFTAIYNGSPKRAVAVALKGSRKDSIHIFNNTFISNHRLIEFQGEATYDTLLNNNTFLWAEDKPASAYAISGNFWAANVSNTSFIDNSLGEDVNFTDIEQLSHNIGRITQNYSIFYTTGFFFNSQGNPLSSVRFNITDTAGHRIFDGTTDATGRQEIILEQSNIYMPINNYPFPPYTITTYEPYSISASYGNATINQSFNLSLDQTISLDFGSLGENCESPYNIYPCDCIARSELTGTLTAWLNGNLNMRDLLTTYHDYKSNPNCEPQIPGGQYTGCDDPLLDTGGLACVEISSCGFYNYPNAAYLLLVQDLHTPMSCLFLGGNITLDLNGYAVYYIDGNYETVTNGDFEEWILDGGKEVPVGWDMSLAPNAEKKRTDSDLHLIHDHYIFVPGGETLISDWVYLPLNNRSYRAMIISKRYASDGYVTIEVENEANEIICSRRVPPENLAAGTTSYCNFHDVPVGNYRLRVTPDRNHAFDLADIRPAHDRGVTAVRYYAETYCHNDAGSACIAPDYMDMYPGVNRPSIHIKNGKILQMHPGFRTYSVAFSGLLGGDINLSQIDVTADGIRSMTLLTDLTGEIAYSNFTINQPFVVNREDIGETQTNVAGDTYIHDNRFIGGQGVIHPSGNNTRIINNYIRNNQSVTNHYAITLSRWTNSNEIINNTFDAEHGSGITLYHSKFNSIIGNSFYTKGEVCDPEYSTGLFSTNAIRFANYNTFDPTIAIEGTNVSHNKFYITGQYYPGYPDCLALANAIFMDVGYNNENYIEDNYFELVNTHEKAMVNAFYLQGSNSGQYRRNVVLSNDAFGWTNRYSPFANNAIFENNTFIKTEPAVPNQICGRFANFRFGYCCEFESKNTSFINNQYINTDPYDNCFSSNHYDPYSFQYRWWLNVHVQDTSGQPLEGAIVTAIATGASESIIETTNHLGNARLTLTEYYEEGTMRPNGIHDKTNYTPHSITAEYGGELIEYGEIIMTGEKDITISMNTGGTCSPEGSTQPCGINIGECEQGIQTCSGGHWGSCIGAVLPTEDTCDGLDNDCDGETDEYLGTTTCGQGVCNHTIQNCIGGIPQTCNPLEGQLPENPLLSCTDGIDQDCDGIDEPCGNAWTLFPADGASGSSDVTFSCGIEDPKGIKEIVLLTDESGNLAVEDKNTYVADAYHFLEAETFTLNPLDWETCSQTETCANTRIRETNIASGYAHRLSVGWPSGLYPMTLNQTFNPDEYVLYARGFNREGVDNRRWNISISGIGSDYFGNHTGNSFQWENNSLLYTLSGTETILIQDAYVDAYWTYPDLILLTNNTAFDPITTCGNDASSLHLTFPHQYTLSTCGLAETSKISTFQRTLSGQTTWACGYIDGQGYYHQTDPRTYTAT